MLLEILAFIFIVFAAAIFAVIGFGVLLVLSMIISWLNSSIDGIPKIDESHDNPWE